MSSPRQPHASALGAASAAEGLFVIGAPRSGTTLMRRVLNSHPRLHLAKETGFLRTPVALELLGRRVALDEGRRGELLAAARVRLEREHWDLAAVRDLLADADTLEAFYARLCRLECPDPGRLAYWGDNTPAYVRIASELLGVYPGARALLVVRDPRAVVHSVLPLEFGANDATAAAVDWVDAMAHGLAAAQVHPGRVLVVRYEDLLEDTQRTLGGIASFLGVDPAFDPDDVSAGAGALPTHVQHHAQLARPLDPSRAERWREGLTDRDRQRVERETRWIARAFGYDLPVGRRDGSPLPALRAASRECLRWSLQRARARLRRS